MGRRIEIPYRVESSEFFRATLRDVELCCCPSEVFMPIRQAPGVRAFEIQYAKLWTVLICKLWHTPADLDTSG